MRTQANPEVISWALARCGKTPEDLKTTVSPRVQQWIDGEGKPPTPKQVKKLAEKTHVLMPYFYMDEIPSLGFQIPDFRTKTAHAPANPSPELYDNINLMQFRQDWLSEYLEGDGREPLDFIGSCHGASDAATVAARMRDMLGLQPGWARALKVDEAVRRLREAMECAGVYVYAGSYYGNSTLRSFDVDEFRGFALADDYAPVIFLNTADAKAAQLFTLAHEFVHLLRGETGVDDVRFAVHDDADESFCDAAAAEFLVPASMVHSVFDRMVTGDPIDELKRLTKTSEVVCLRRARDLGRMSAAEFHARYRDYLARLSECPKKPKSKNDGPTFYVMQKNHLGGLFPETIYAALRSDSLLYSDAYRLTGMNAKSFNKFFLQEGFAV